MSDLDLYAELVENDTQNDISMETPKDVVDYVNRLQHKHSALQTEVQALQARISRLEVERTQLIAAKDQISDNFVRLGLACRQEVSKLKQRVSWLCKKAKVKEPKFNSAANQAIYLPGELNLEKPVVYSTLLSFLHTSQPPPDREPKTVVATTMDLDLSPTVIISQPSGSSGNLQPNPNPHPNVRQNDSRSERPRQSSSCSSSSSGSTRSSSSSTSSSASSRPSSACPSGGKYPPASSALPLSTPVDINGPQNHLSLNRVSSLAKSDLINPRRHISPSRSRYQRQQGLLDDWKAECNDPKTRREQINDATRTSQPLRHRELSKVAPHGREPLANTRCERSERSTTSAIRYRRIGTSPHTAHISAASHVRGNGPPAPSKIASYDEWEANRLSRPRTVRHQLTIDRSHSHGGDGEDSPNYSCRYSDDQTVTIDGYRDKQHVVGEFFNRRRPPDSQQSSKCTTMPTAVTTIPYCANDDKDRSQFQSIKSEVRNRSVTTDASGNQLDNSALETEELPSGGSHRRRRSSGKRGSTPPTVYTKRLRGRQDNCTTLPQSILSRETPPTEAAPQPEKDVDDVEIFGEHDDGHATDVHIASPSESPMMPDLDRPDSFTVTCTNLKAAPPCRAPDILLAEQEGVGICSTEVNDALTGFSKSKSPLQKDHIKMRDKFVSPTSSSLSTSSVSHNLQHSLGETESPEPTNNDSQLSPQPIGNLDNPEEVGSDHLTAQQEVSSGLEPDDHWSSWDEAVQPACVSDGNPLTASHEVVADVTDLVMANPPNSTVLFEGHLLDNLTDEYKEEGEIADEDYEDAVDEVDRPGQPNSQRCKRSWSVSSRESTDNASWLTGKKCRKRSYHTDRQASSVNHPRVSSVSSDIGYKAKNAGTKPSPAMNSGNRDRKHIGSSRSNWQSKASPDNDRKNRKSLSGQSGAPSPRRSGSKPRIISPISETPPYIHSSRRVHVSSFSNSPGAVSKSEGRLKSNPHGSSSSAWCTRRSQRTSTDREDGDGGDHRLHSSDEHIGSDAAQRYAISSATEHRKVNRQAHGRSGGPANHDAGNHNRQKTPTTKTAYRGSRSPSGHRLGGMHFSCSGGGGFSQSSRSRLDREVRDNVGANRRPIYRSSTIRGGSFSPPAVHRLTSGNNSEYRRTIVPRRRRAPPPSRVSRAHRRF